MIARFYEWFWGFPPEYMFDCVAFIIGTGIIASLVIFLLTYFWLEILPIYRNKNNRR